MVGGLWQIKLFALIPYLSLYKSCLYLKFWYFTLDRFFFALIFILKYILLKCHLSWLNILALPYFSLKTSVHSAHPPLSIAHSLRLMILKFLHLPEYISLLLLSLAVWLAVANGVRKKWRCVACKPKPQEALRAFTQPHPFLPSPGEELAYGPQEEKLYGATKARYVSRGNPAKSQQLAHPRSGNLQPTHRHMS